MFYRYCSRRAADTSRVGRRAYIARAFSRLLQDLWISVCLSPSLSCPAPVPQGSFFYGGLPRGSRRGEAGEEVKERDFFSTFLFRFCFATRQFNWGGEYILVAVACCWKVFF